MACASESDRRKGFGSGVLAQGEEIPRPQSANGHPQGVAVAVWWRRGELNPRPQVLYRQIYILSQVVSFNRMPANRQADIRRVTLNLAFRKVTLRRASSCK